MWSRRRWQSLWFGGSRLTPETARLNRRCGRSRFSPTAATSHRGSRWRSTPRGRWWSAFVVGTSSRDGAAGNAALAIGDLARERDLLPRLAALEPVAPLLAVCHKRTGAAQKNAAIACARLATHSGMLETLKANNGLELIYRYVQP